MIGLRQKRPESGHVRGYSVSGASWGKKGSRLNLNSTDSRSKILQEERQLEYLHCTISTAGREAD